MLASVAFANAYLCRRLQLCTANWLHNTLIYWLYQIHQCIIKYVLLLLLFWAFFTCLSTCYTFAHVGMPNARKSLPYYCVIVINPRP